ncbi:MAG: D-alanine--D-alanine ligase [Propionibacteriaceae bacterium]|jgi:D-alanine-D-alanine ligase|nr:D-alanine--D-alanine ligase [Propionibacteriaceae bacterium]
MAQQVIVVSGGLSHEREVSIESGRRVCKELTRAGFDVSESDVQASLIDLIRSLDHPVVVPMLHGGSGEDGAVREVFELMGVHYVGTRAPACRASFDKALAVPVVAKAGLTVPKRVVLPHEMFRDLGANVLLDLIEDKLGLPLFVKPTMSGSALGASRVDRIEDLPAAMVNAYSYGRTVVVEEFIAGVEVAVPVFDFGEGPLAFPPVEIRPASGSYDFEARYTAGATTYICPAELDDATLKAVQDAAVTAHRCLSLRDFSRADIIVRDGVPVFIESSVAPGMTDTSLVPLSLATAGQDFGDALAAVVRQSAIRQVESSL